MTTLSKTKIPLTQALALAEKIVKELRPACAKIEVAGSVRRKKEMVGDIEIVCIPEMELDLFGHPQASWLDTHLEHLARKGRIIKAEGKEKRWGPKWKSFHPAAKPELKVDLFITTKDEWGYTYTIRTGSSDFSRRIVTPRRQGGFLPGHLRVAECRLWEGMTALDTPEEESFFEALGLEWIEPENRV